MERRGFKPRKNIKCDACGKTLHKSDYFKGGTTCLDCLAARDGGILCKNCNRMHPPSMFRISAEKTYRIRSCSKCYTRKKNDGSFMESHVKYNEKVCECGEKAIDLFRGKFVCEKCLNPDYEISIEAVLASNTMIGNGLGHLVEENNFSRAERYTHR